MHITKKKEKLFKLHFSSIVVCLPCSVIPALSSSIHHYLKSSFLPFSPSLYSLEASSLKNTDVCCAQLFSLICEKCPSSLNGQKVTENRISPPQSSPPQFSLIGWQRAWPLFQTGKSGLASQHKLPKRDCSISFPKLCNITETVLHSSGGQACE